MILYLPTYDTPAVQVMKLCNEKKNVLYYTYSLLLTLVKMPKTKASDVPIQNAKGKSNNCLIDFICLNVDTIKCRESISKSVVVASIYTIFVS